MYQILEYETQVLDSREFLSDAASNLILGMIQFNYDFEKLAKAVDGEEPPKPVKPSAMAEVWPSHEVHTEEENFFADKNKDPEESKNCNKDYPEDRGITGGIGHVTCRHGIVKGFTALKKGESPGLFT